MLHTRVEAHDWFAIGQDDRQLQLCVPLVSWTPEWVSRDDGLRPMRIDGRCPLEESLASAVSFDHPLGSLGS